MLKLIPQNGSVLIYLMYVNSNIFGLDLVFLSVLIECSRPIAFPVMFVHLLFSPETCLLIPQSTIAKERVERKEMMSIAVTSDEK